MSVVRPPTYEPAPRRRKTSRELLEEILEEIGPVAPQAPAPEETARAVNQPPAIGIMGQERSRRRAAAGLPINIGVAEPEDLETSPEKYGYVGGKNPVQIAEEAYRATGGPEHLAEREAQYARDLAKARHGTESQAALADVRRLDQAVVDKVEDELRAGTSPYLKEQLFPPSPMTSAITWGHAKLGNLKPLPEEYVRAKRRLENDIYGREGDIIPEIGHGVVGGAKLIFDTIFSPVTEIVAKLRERSPQDPLAKGLETVAAFATPGLAKFTAGTAAAQWAARSIIENTGLSDRAKEDALEAIGFAGGLAAARARFSVSGAKAAYGKAVEGTKAIGAEIRGATSGGGGTTYGPEGLRFQTPGGLEAEALSREGARLAGGAGEIEAARAQEAKVVGALARGHTAEKALGVVRDRRAALEAENATKRAQQLAARDTEATREAREASPRTEEEYRRLAETEWETKQRAEEEAYRRIAAAERMATEAESARIATLKGKAAGVKGAFAKTYERGRRPTEAEAEKAVNEALGEDMGAGFPPEPPRPSYGPERGVPFATHPDVPWETRQALHEKYGRDKPAIAAREQAAASFAARRMSPPTPLTLNQPVTAPAEGAPKTIPALKPADIPWAMPYVDPYAGAAPKAPDRAPKAPAPAAKPAPALSAEPLRPAGGLPTKPQAELRPTDIDIAPAVMVDGKIIAGNKGQTHASIEATLPKDAPPGSIQSGWVDSDGKFLTDDQAAEVVAKSQGRPVDKAMGHSAYVSFSEDAKAAGIDLSRVEPRDIWDAGSAVEYESGVASKLSAAWLNELIERQDSVLAANPAPIEMAKAVALRRVYANALREKPAGGLPTDLTPKTKGERGRLLNPVELAKQAGRAIADLFDSAREKLSFEDNPKLDRVATGIPLFTAADEIKALRLAKANVGEQTESWVKNFVIKGSGIKDRLAYDRVSEYLIFLRDRDLLLSGKKSADLTLERVEQELRAVEETIDPAVLAKVRAHHKELTDITAKKLKDMGLKNEWTDSTNPDGSPKFYSPRVILARKAGKGTGGGGSTIAERAPGSLRHTEGTELDRESDGFKALGYHIQDVLSSWYDYQFAKNMKARSLNAQIREGDIPDDVALYSFGKKGAGTVVNDVDVTKLLSKGEFIDKRGVRRRRTTYREAFEEGPPDVKESFKKVEPGDPFLRLDQFGEPTGEELYAFPRETVEGLAEASQRMSPPPRSGLGRLINSASGVIRRLRIAGPSYLGRQLLEDPAWASYNLPPQYVTHFLAELKRQSRIVREEMAKERRGERSKIMEEARLGTAERPPMVNASFENLMYDVVERGGAKLEPWFKKSLTNKLVYVLDGFDLPAKIVSEWRELSNKLAIAETLETKMGLDPMLAGKRAHEYLGNYWSRSPVMEEYGNLSIFLKWASEATIKMTRNFAKDPRTGNSSVRGFLEGPLSKSLVFGTIVATWNDYIISNMKPEGRKDEPLELPLSAGGDGYFGQAFIVPTWKSGRPVPMRASDGNLIAISISGARGILDGLVDTSDAVVRGRLAKATGIVGKGLIGHLAPQLQIPLEAYTGNRMSGQPITSYRHQNLSAEQQSALNLKDHPYSPIALAFKAAGIPYTDKAAYFASQALGGIPRNIESLFASDQNLIDRARGSVGIPLMSFDPRSGNQQAAYREADDLFAIISRETGKRVAGRPYSQEAIQAAYTRARQLDPKLPGVLKRRLKSGFTTFAKEAPLTPTQRKEQQLQRKYGPKTPAAPFESSGPANPPF